MMRVSKQWSLLRPEIVDSNVVEEFDVYYHRILATNKFNHIPIEVFKQWIHENYMSEISTKNYGWLNYEEIKFELVEMSTDEILKIKVVKFLKDSIISDWKITKIKEINCDDEDMAHWKNKGTWRIPPIIIDVDSIKTKIPKRCELNRPYQLVEGYSRLRNFHNINKLKESEQIDLSENHLVYLMSAL
jgi:hypothetical protein